MAFSGATYKASSGVLFQKNVDVKSVLTLDVKKVKRADVRRKEEVCPFCGKPFKRLKAHLPHCKAKKEPPTHTRHPKHPPSDDDGVEPSTSTLTTGTAASPQKTPAILSTRPGMKKSKASVPSTSSSMMKPTDTEITSSSSVSTKKKKRKLMDEIKSSSSSISPSPPPPLPPSYTLSKPKKKSLRALMEASRSAAVLSEPQGGSSSTSLDLLSVSSSDTQTSSTSLLLERQLTPQQDTKPKGISKKNSQLPEKTPKASGRTSVEDREVQIVGGVVKLVSREDEGPKGPNTPENKLSVDAEDTTQSRITLQGVKAASGRSNTTSSILEQVQASVLTADTRTKGPVTVEAVQSNPGQFSDTVSEAQEPAPVSRQSPEGRTAKSTSSSSSSGSWQHGPSSILPPVPIIPTVIFKEGPNLSRNQVGPFSPPVSQLAEGGASPGAPPSSSPLPRPPAPPVTSRPREALMTVNPLLRVKKADVVVNRIGGVLAERRLAQVKLSEVPAWLALKTPSHPAEVVDMLRGGWQWYNRKYIDVRRGGVGGVAMLLVGYCALSYMWSYPHIKRDRWRKYH